MKPELLDCHRSQAIHYLDRSQRPATIACGTAVKGSYMHTIDKDRVTCRQCWGITHPQYNYYADQGDRR